MDIVKILHSMMIPLATYDTSVLGVVSYEKYLSKIDKFKVRDCFGEIWSSKKFFNWPDCE